MAQEEKRSALVVLGLVVVVSVPAVAGVLGQVALNGVRIDGTPVPTGTTVLSPSLVETGSYSSTVHLSTGHLLNLGPHSSAFLESGSQGGIQLVPRGGQVFVGDPSGQTFQLASNSIALEPAQSLSPKEMSAFARDAEQEIDEIDKRIQKLLADAERRCSPETVDCLVTTSRSVRSVQRVTSQAQQEMEEFLTEGDTKLADHEFRKIALSLSKARQFDAEASGCVGEGSCVDDPGPEPGDDPVDDSPSPDDSPPSPGGGDGLSTGAKVGIAIGAGFGTIVVIQGLDDPVIDCQPADASPFVPGMPICGT